MQYFTKILILGAAASVVALPLNINLGAYSPALVVGDGEISFGGGAEAAALVETLQGASTTAAGTEAALAKASTVGDVTPSAVAIPFNSIGKSVAAREPEAEIDEAQEQRSNKEKRDLASFNAALTYASGALKTSPGVELGTGEGGSGVGIIVKPGGAVARDVKDEAEAAVVKRDEGSGPTVTLLKIRTLGDSS